MSEAQVLVFFYGSYMNRDVLAEVNLSPKTWEMASLPGFDIRICPRANLVRSAAHVVFGVLASATHRELDRLYAHARDILGERYLPEAVLVHTRSGIWQSALCYLAEHMIERRPESEYIERILRPARELGFPTWYVTRLESFRS